MAVLGRLMDHVRLIERMAMATGTDLVGAYEAGALSQADWAAMVRTCRGCAWAGNCGAWLDRHETVPCAPASCPNRQPFRDLRSRTPARAEGGK
ncbi:DUF6455 family protein [Antarcticimicrobium luteum]|uniref:DUF6455 family protein n=1 Tax=Antarcticimicrobium luteum TaxID=2547397 RepID=UPI00247A53AA|nr:DUF6455 family protein [Antarcticimicrobium luteum]